MDILQKQKDLLIRRAISRSAVKKHLKYCPVCEKNRLKKLVHSLNKINNQYHPEKNLDGIDVPN